MKSSILFAPAFAGLCLAAINSTCRSDAGSGTCKQSTSCTSGFTVKGACPSDGPSILCCIQKSCNTPSGSGTCENTSTSVSGGKFIPGHCPGDSSVQCYVKSATAPPNNPSRPPIPPPNDPKPTPNKPDTDKKPDDKKPADDAKPSGGNVPTLNAVQSGHARTIAKVAKAENVGKRGCVVAIATALQESGIRVLANKKSKESQRIKNDGIGNDHDSVGIFQQRPQFWGTTADCMDPAKSTKKFLDALKKVKGWEKMRVTDAAQKVQRSAFGEAYQKHEKQATTVCNAVF